MSLIAAILTEDGYRKGLTAQSVKEGMELFHTSRPDMAILDIMLPDGDGFALFRQMREESEIPILFLSAKDEDEDRLFGLGLGADDYITKPFLPKELLLRVRAVLKRTYRMKEEKAEPVKDHPAVLSDRRRDHPRHPFVQCSCLSWHRLYDGPRYGRICLWTGQYGAYRGRAVRGRRGDRDLAGGGGYPKRYFLCTVSYTHLTLPTIQQV